MSSDNKSAGPASGRGKTGGAKQVYSPPRLQQFGRVAYLTTGSDGDSDDAGTKRQTSQ